ncbi:MAG: DEAD/DEAH box helicase [Thermodesulfobacteriota bacterium]
MNLKEKANKEISAYQSLPPVQKNMVRIMAVNIDYCRLNKLVDCLAGLGLTRDSGRKITVSSLQPLQNELMEKGLLLKTGKGVCCPESVRQKALHDILLKNRFAEIAEVLQVNMPPTGGAENYHQLLRNFQIALFTRDNMEDIYWILDSYYNGYSRHTQHEDPFLTTLNKPFSPPIIEKIAPAIRLDVLGFLLLAAVRNLEPAAAIVENIEQNRDPGAGGPVCLPAVIFYFLSTGDISRARSLLENSNDDIRLEKLEYLGWLEFISGNYEHSLQSFAEALKLLKEITRKRKEVLPGYFGLFHLLALLRSGERSRLEEGLEYMNIARKKNKPVMPLVDMLRPVFQDQLGLPDHESLSAFYGYEDEPLVLFLSHLALAWTDKAMARTGISELNTIRDRALKNKYLWLAAELSALLAFLGQDRKKNRALAAELHHKCKTVSFVDMVREQPQWEKALNHLLTIPDNSETGKENNQEQRLIWLFAHNEKYNLCRLSPRMQKKSKKGGWTRGRPVALKNLYRNHSEMAGLTGQDLRVCRAIKEEYYRVNWRYGRTEYGIDHSMALPALVDHPLLFLEDSPDVRVELVMAEPELRLRKEKNKLKLSVFPEKNEMADQVVVIRDTPSRFKVIRFGRKHREIIERIGSGITVPQTGEKLVKQVVDSLSSLVTVQSDLASEQKAESIEADSRPHAHLIPYRDGISLEFLVKPCGAGGSSFRPGRGGKSVLTEIDGSRIQAERNFRKEKEMLDKVILSCPSLSRLEEIENQYLVDDPEEALELLLELRECDDDLVLEWPRGQKMKVRKEVSLNRLSMQIKKDRDWFRAGGSLQIDDSMSLELRRLLDMLNQATGRFIPLDDGTFLALTGELRKRLDELAAFSEGHGKGVRFAPLAAMALEDLTEGVGQLESDGAWKEKCRQFSEVITPEVPSTLQASLRDYQMNGFRWLARLSHWGVGGCLADDMGLGKTVQALAAILLRAALGPTLVVAPLSVTSNWQEEARRFAPTLNVKLLGPGDREQLVAGLQPFDLLVVSYGLLPLEAELLSGVHWQTVVLDEAQAIKNMQTKRSKAAMQLRAEFKIITTGTPVENHLGELWTLFNFLNPGLLGPFKKFNEKFIAPIERDRDHEARNRLRKLIRPFILRRLKSDVLRELPAKTEITLEVEMGRDEMMLYEARRLKALENISSHDDEGAGQKHLRILGEIMKLRRLCCNPALVLPESTIRSSKLKVFGDTLSELLSNNHKALVFSQFVDHLRIIRGYLEERKISCQYLDGSTPRKAREERIKNFQNGEADVFLISLKAGGSGLNLTAADYVIHMDPWWNPAVEDQASDRAHRLGQERPVTVYRLVVKDSIEEQIVELHKEKRELADSLLEGTDAAGKISAQELLNLLQK